MSEDKYYERIKNPLPRKRTWQPRALRNYPRLDDSHIALAEMEKIRYSYSLRDDDYWALLSHVWIYAPRTPDANDRGFYIRFRDLFSSSRRCRNVLMTPDERRLFDKLHRPVIYRGCKMGENERGMSWTLSEAVAERFCITYAPLGPRLIRMGRARKRDILAYFNYDEEEEILIFPERISQIWSWRP